MYRRPQRSSIMPWLVDASVAVGNFICSLVLIIEGLFMVNFF